MTDEVIDRAGVPVLVLAEDGPLVAGPQDAVDLIGATWGGTDTVAVPVRRLDPAFFTLSSGVAGEIMQKFVNYRVRLVVVGDLTAHTAVSGALTDLIRESNQGSQVWFVPTLADLDARLANLK